MTRTGTPQSTPPGSTPAADDTRPGPAGVTTADRPTEGMGLEPKPAGASDAQAIFVSPRVVDRLAFEEYAGILRKLVGDAAVQRDLLKSAAEQARGAEGGTAALNKQLQTRVEQAARALPMLDQRLAKAEQLLSLPMELLAGEKAKAVEKARKELEEQLSALIDDQVRHFRSQFESTIRERIDALAKDAIGDASEPVIARANAAATQLEQTVTEAEARVSSLVNLAESQSERAATARNRQVEDLEKRMAARVATCDAELAQRARSAEEAGKALDERIEAATVTLGEVEKIKPSKLEKALERLASIRQSLGDLGRFEAMITKAEDLAQSAVFATSQLEAVKNQADQARAALGTELLDGAAKIDAIEGRLSQLLAAAQQAGTRIGDAETRLQTRMNELETRVEGMTARVQAATPEDPARQIELAAEQTRKMGEWLAQIIRQAHDCGRTLDQVMRDAESLAARLETLTSRPEFRRGA
jgi:hypothetical protein